MTQEQPSGAVREADEIAEQFVVDAAAADPLMATFCGIAGHDHQLLDYTPDGYAARTGLLRSARAAMAAARPSDDRERVAQQLVPRARRRRAGPGRRPHMPRSHGSA